MLFISILMSIKAFKIEIHFIIKEIYSLDKSISLNACKILLSYEKSRISFKT